MAEKEERVYTFTKEQMCNKCKEICAEWDGLVADCGNCGYVLLHAMTRQEAIERIAKALFKVDNVLALDIEFEQLEKHKQLEYKVFAEAALDALLGESND